MSYRTVAVRCNARALPCCAATPRSAMLAAFSCDALYKSPNWSARPARSAWLKAEVG